jgi:hypothetical protein
MTACIGPSALNLPQDDRRFGLASAVPIEVRWGAGLSLLRFNTMQGTFEKNLQGDS